MFVPSFGRRIFSVTEAPIGGIDRCSKNLGQEKIEATASFLSIVRVFRAYHIPYSLLASLWPYRRGLY